MSSWRYDLGLIAICLGAVIAASAANNHAEWRVRSELRIAGLSGVLPGWGRLDAPAVRFEPHGRLLHLEGGARFERPDLELRVFKGEIALSARRAHFQEIEGRAGATRVEVSDAKVRAGALVARDIEVTGSLRRRRVNSVRVTEVAAALDELERWRERTRRGGWQRHQAGASAGAPVRLRVHGLTERATELVLRNVELVFAAGARIRARAVTVPKRGGACLLEEVTIDDRGGRHELEEMSLDLATLELVPRRSLVARALGQQWGTGLRLEELEVSP